MDHIGTKECVHMAGNPSAGKVVSVKSAATTQASPTAARGNVASPFKAFRRTLKDAGFELRVRAEREGVPSEMVVTVMKEMGSTAGEFQRIVGVPKSTFAKKISEKSAFAGAAGQAVLGLAELVNLAEDLVDPKGRDAAGFDAGRWVGEWIQRPQPALGGRKPADLMDTPTGRESVKRVLGALGSGAYL
jgi:uncharacterized protein (DUF2384 family)